MRKRAFVSFLAGLWAAAGLLIYAQQKAGDPPPGRAEAPQGGHVIRAEVNLVSLPVTVRSHDGGFIKGLKKEQFHVYEDDALQEISTFAQERVPVHVVLLIDASGSVRGEWGSIKNAARRFADQLGPEDRMAVVVFNHETRLMQDWTPTPAQVSLALDKVFPKGRTFLWDAVYVACDDLLKGVQGKKAIILLSDGFDNCVSGTDIHPRRCVDFPEALDVAAKSDAMLYVVSEVQALRQQMEFFAREQGRRDDIPPSAYAQADLLLKKLAFETGGKVLYPDSFGELGNVYAQVAEELKNQYSIGYVSANTLKDGSYRKVRVAVERPNVSVSTRPGYYAPRRPS